MKGKTLSSIIAIKRNFKEDCYKFEPTKEMYDKTKNYNPDNFNE